MNYYDEIKNKIIDNEIYSKVKDYSKERYKVITYYEIGRLLNEAGNKYGDSIIKKYSEKLTIQFGKNYSYRNLFNMRKYYNTFKNEKLNAVRSQFNWTKYCILWNKKIIFR